MKLGVFLAVYHGRTWEEALDAAVALGVEAVEIATGNYPGDSHCRPAELLADEGALVRFRAAVDRRGLTISALSQQGNPLHPDRSIAAAHQRVWRDTVLLAARLGVGVVNAFAGCPGDHDGARRPNWVTCAWPQEFAETLAWQWDERVLPYWRAEAAFAAEHGVVAAIEMHPGTVVHNPATLLRLRQACGPTLAANYDPSHLFWQGVDPIAAVERLGADGAVVHVDAKDTELLADRIAADGVLETRPAAAVDERAWRFRTIGVGHDATWWGRLVDALRRIGYDGAVSIEHEDRLVDPDLGLRESARLLGSIL